MVVVCLLVDSSLRRHLATLFHHRITAILSFTLGQAVALAILGLVFVLPGTVVYVFRWFAVYYLVADRHGSEAVVSARVHSICEVVILLLRSSTGSSQFCVNARLLSFLCWSLVPDVAAESYFNIAVLWQAGFVDIATSWTLML